MFTKNISITEKIESHLNSSSDENGEDDSFDESGKDDFENPSIDELKNKIARYNYHINKIQNKRKEMLRDKSTSLWQSVYYTFFGNYNNGAVTLHELNLRCKFLFNMDKVYGFEKEIEKKKIKPLTNIEQFIRMYSLKKEGNLLVKIFSEKKDKKMNEELIELQRKVRAYTIRKKGKGILDPKEKEDKKDNKDIKEFLKEYKEDKKDNKENKDNKDKIDNKDKKEINDNKDNKDKKDITKKKDSNTKAKGDKGEPNNKHVNFNNNNGTGSNQTKTTKNMTKSKSADYIESSINVNKEVTEKRHYLKSLLELNDFNLQDEELYDIIQELTMKYKQNKDKQKLDNLTKIIKGDFIYKQELDNAMKLNDPFLNECSYILDVNSERPFLINNIDVDLISKYEHNLGPQDRLSRQVNNFINKILSKLNPNFKVED